MKVVAILEAKKAVLIDKPDPRPKNEFVVVKLHATPMCTEYGQFREGTPGDAFGHEAAGEVYEVDGPSNVKVGDRVVVMPGNSCGKCSLCLNGDYIHCEHNRDINSITGNAYCTATYAQYLVKQDRLLLPIPDDISYEHASMACCGLGPTFNAMQQMDVGAFDTVLITGMGPVGLGGVINGVFRGANVIAVESNPYRSKLAKELGAKEVIDPKDTDAIKKIMDLTGGIGVDKAIDTSGTAEAKTFLTEVVKRRGHMALIGWNGQIDAGNIIAKGLHVHGAWHWNLLDAPRMMDMIRRSATSLDKLITHKLPMSKVQDAFEIQLTGNCGKIVLDPCK